MVRPCKYRPAECSVAGFVLAGGASSRMGRDKGLLPFGGSTLALHIAREVERAAGSVVLIGAPEAYGGNGRVVLPDLRPGYGPLGGMETALHVTEATWNAIVACDLPGVRASFVRRLLEQAAASEADCVVPVTIDGRMQPLCAVYHRRCLPEVRAALDANRRKVRALLAEIRVECMRETDAAIFDNINTPEDWARYLSTQPRGGEVG